MAKIVIIGNGIAGVTAARNIRKQSNTEILIISSESDYFFSRTSLMYIFLGQLKAEHTKPYEDWFWEKNKIELLRDYVSAVLPDEHQIKTSSGKTIHYSKLIIATGSVPARFGWPGENLPGVQGFYHLQDLELMEENTKDIQQAVIVGGGLIGVEMAEMLLSRNIEVTILAREQNYWDNVLPIQEARILNHHIEKHGVNLLLNTELHEIIAGEDGRVNAVKTKQGHKLNCQFVGLTVGVVPNIKWLEGSKIETGKGILVNEYLQTNIEDIYAIGDCAELRHPKPGRRKTEAVWYTGKLMGERLASTLTGNTGSYDPGIWYNSAKFFDIEYQTYGTVGNMLRKDEDEFYWQHRHGEKCLHFVFDKTDRHFKGINSLGIRLRHRTMEKWLRNKNSIDYVIEHFSQALFDPEFSENHEKKIKEEFLNFTHTSH